MRDVEHRVSDSNFRFQYESCDRDCANVGGNAILGRIWEAS